MKKDLKILNRSLAFIVAAATAMTSMPSTLLAADMFSDGSDAAVEAQVVEETAAVDELAADASAFVSEEPEEIFFDGETVTEVTEGTDPAEADAAAQPQKPGAVTNVAYDEDDSNVLTWYAVQDADYYQVKIEDAEGYFYGSTSGSWNDTYGKYMYQPAYVRTSSLEYDLDYNGYSGKKVNADGTITYKEDASGNDVYMLAGQTYTVSVRAVNELNGLYAYGDWTAPVTYTVPADIVPETVTISVEDDILRFNATQSGVSYEMAITDAAGREYYGYVTHDSKYDSNTGKVTYTPEYHYVSAYSGNSLDNIGAYVYTQGADGYATRATDAAGQYIKAFNVGEAYTIKVRSYTGSGTTKKASEWSNAVVYTKTEIPVPDKTGNFKLNDEQLTWNEVEDAYGYEVEVNGAAEVITRSGSYYNYLYLTNYDQFTKGQQYSIRVRAYNYKQDNNTKQYGEWSDAFVFIYAAEDTSLKKISGLSVDAYGAISWNRDDNAGYYQIMVKDEYGREYFTSSTEGGTQGVYWTSYSSYADAGEYTLYTYTIVDGTLTPVIYPATGSAVRAFESGKTYTIAVRAAKSVYDSATDTTNTVTGEWSNVVSYKVPATAQGVNAAPAAVTGVEVKTTASYEEDFLSGATLQWNYQDNISYYEVLVKDAAGREYVDNYKIKNDGTIEYTYASVYDTSYYPSTLLKNIANKGLYTYIKNHGAALDTVKDASGKALTFMTAGETYSFQVRAVREYTEKDAATGASKTTELYGDWSAAVTYTVPAIEPITDLAYASADDEYYYFTYSASLANSSLWYQIAADNTFSTATRVTGNGWVQYGTPSGNKFAISKNRSYLEDGKTYYVRVVNSVKEPTDDEVAALNPAAAAFTTDAAAAPKNITGLKLYNTTENSFEFRFDAVLEDDDYYELQYTDKSPAAEEDWASAGRTSTLYFSSLKEGTWYVRAVAYVYDDQNKKVYGVPSNVVPVTLSYATTAISSLKYVEKTPDGYKFTFTGTPRKNETVEYWYSESADFTSDRKVTTVAYAKDNSYVLLDFDDLTPGKTYYVRARVVNNNAENSDTTYSAYTNVVKLTASMPRISIDTTVITKKTVTLRMSDASEFKGWLTGYQIQRKDGKKYVTLTKTTNSLYKDSGLKADTTYTYRVRPYYYNQETNKTKYGSWAYEQVTTWGGALNLKATPKSTKNIKLSWSKISGAQGYEIYRYAGTSSTTSISDGLGNGFSKYTLVKTVGKKVSSYADKKLTSGLDYTYIVRAYKTVGKQKYYIEDYDYASLAFGGVSITRRVRYTNGKVKVYWDPVYAADGYVIEKYDELSDTWSKFKTLKKAKGSYTFAAVQKDTNYRIRAYKGKEYAEPETITVSPFLAAPTGVKAKAKASDGSITVSWKAVAGADYYRVYRTTSSEYYYYDKNSKSYNYSYGSVVPVYVADNTQVSGYKLITDTEDLNMTQIVDRPITYTANGVTNTVYEGPTPGVKYYYYVVAYKNGQAYNVEGTYDESYATSSGDSKAASATVTSAKISRPSKSTVKAASKKVTISWKKVKNATGYEVYRSTKKKSGYTKIAVITKASTRKYVDKTATAGKTYYYKVRAVGANEAGVSIYSSYTSPKKVKAK